MQGLQKKESGKYCIYWLGSAMLAYTHCSDKRAPFAWNDVEGIGRSMRLWIYIIVESALVRVEDLPKCRSFGLFRVAAEVDFSTPVLLDFTPDG
jgi:hypothetical protein